MVLGIILVVVGLIGLAAGTVAFGDIGLACSIGGIAALLSGIAHMTTVNKLKKMQSTIDSQAKNIKQLAELAARRR